jgi:hypothetical protein
VPVSPSKWVPVGLIIATMQVLPATQTMGIVTQSYRQTVSHVLLLLQSFDCSCHVVSILFSHFLNLCPSLLIRSYYVLHSNKSIDITFNLNWKTQYKLPGMYRSHSHFWSSKRYVMCHIGQITFEFIGTRLKLSHKMWGMSVPNWLHPYFDLCTFCNVRSATECNTNTSYSLHRVLNKSFLGYKMTTILWFSALSKSFRHNRLFVCLLICGSVVCFFVGCLFVCLSVVSLMFVVPYILVT